MFPQYYCRMKNSSAQQNPTITFITKETVADLGGTVELKCAVQYAAEYPVMWIRLPDTPLSFRGSRIVPENRYAVRYDQSSMTFSLQIQDLQETDAGVYQCQVQVSSTTKIKSEVALHIRRPPVISDDSTRDLVVGRGEDVLLYCNASGFPHPKVSWRRQGNALLPTGGTVHHGTHLKLLDIQKEHRGSYLCVADNAVGQGDRRNINIRVEFSPVLKVDRPRVGQAVYHDRELECHVEGFPAPQVEWRFGNKKIVNDQHHEVSAQTVLTDHTEMKLRLRNIQRKQYGTYQCVATNKLGSAQGNVELYETAHAVGDYRDRSLPAGVTDTACSLFPVTILFFIMFLCHIRL